LGKISLILMLLTVISLTGCTGGSNPSWAGTMVHEYTTQAAGEDPVDHAVLFVGTKGGKLSAYDLLDDRKPLWSQNVGTGAVLYGRPVASGEYVYIASYGAGDSGGEVWKFNVDVNTETPTVGPLGGKVVGSLAVGLGYVYVGTEDGVLHALNADTLVEEWKYPDDGTTLPDRIWGTPTLDITDAEANEGVVYFGCFDNKLYALDAVTGQEVWDEPFETGGAIGGKPLVYNGKVYFGSFDRKFYALDKTTGATAWTTPFQAGKWFWTEPIVYDATDNDIDDGIIYVGCLDNKIYALSSATGAKVSQFIADSPISSPPVVAVLPGADEVLGSDDDLDVIVVTSGNGIVYGLDPANLVVEIWFEPFPMQERVESPISAHVSVLGDDVYQQVYIYGYNGTLTSLWLTTGLPAGWELENV